MIIGGVDIPENKNGVIALSSIRGIGTSLAKKILINCGIDINLKVCEYTEEDVNKIRNYIDKNCNKIESELAKEVHENIEVLKSISCYRGIRHKKGLPVRGQRTKTNARTRKGRRKTVANKKMADKKG